MIVKIEGDVTTPLMSKEWGDAFIAWLESRGESFAGTTKLDN